MEEQRRLLLNANSSNSHSSEEEWSDESDSESYYSDSDSSVPEWESSVDDNTGELLFINCHPFVTQNNIETNKQKERLEPFSKNQIRRSTRGKFLRLIRRRESKRHSRRYQKTHDNVEINTSNKVKFHDSQQGEEKEVVLNINELKLYPNNSLSEKLLGINVSTLSDGNRVMIAGFLPDGEAKHEKNIKIGDWLKSINNIDVTYQNLNNVLEKLNHRPNVLLKLQRVAGVEVTKDPPINELNCQSRFVRQLVNAETHNSDILEVLTKYPIGILYLNTETLSETSAEFEDVIYCYPRPYQKSILCNAKGIFITLNHLIADVTKRKPKTSSMVHNDRIAHVVYTMFGTKLLLLMIPDECTKLKEATLLSDEILRMIQFLYLDLDRCFMDATIRSRMDHFFERLFTRLLNNGEWITCENFLTLHEAQNFPIALLKFEEFLPVAKFLQLPDEAYMQLDDALTELEASDYREWNEDPLDCQRLFTILGSVLYHQGYLLASHLMYEDLVDVHSFCRQQGFFHLSKNEPVKTLVLWKEVFPYSCNRFENCNVKIPDGKRYLLIVGSGKNLLAVIMEAGGCTEPAEPNMGPDAFYVEEAQATLAHIQELGLPELADRWLAMNPGPQITIPEISNRKKTDFLENLNKAVSQTRDQQKPEVTSILKRRNSDQAFVTTSSTFSLSDDHSEDSGSQRGQYEVGDEVGRRRGERKIKYDSNDEESGSDDCADGSQMSNSSFDISELRQTLLSETEDILPQQLTSGSENVLFHFIKFNTGEGTLICPPECRLQSQTLDMILQNFRTCCYKIHSLFQNTLRFKNMPTQDMAKSVMNKSLIAIKEHGTLFECPFLNETDSKKHKIRYWVIGRLFFIPHPKEVYVCYQDTIPQNIIELAFKIDLSM